MALGQGHVSPRRLRYPAQLIEGIAPKYGLHAADFGCEMRNRVPVVQLICERCQRGAYHS
jgi:hypothetical protein